MCMKVECPTCHKPTWKGCGQHIESALSGKIAILEATRVRSATDPPLLLLIPGVSEADRCPNWKTGKH